MALRLIEIMLPRKRAGEVRQMLEHEPDGGLWEESLNGGQILVRFVVDASETGPLIDRFQNRFHYDPAFQLLILPVAAALPRRDDDPADGGDDTASPKPHKPKTRARLSREELHHEIEDMARISSVFIAAVILSSIVAAIGMLRGNVAAIIGAMVIAPLLGPNVALAFGTAIGDGHLLKRAFVTNLLGLVIALALAGGCGLAMAVDPAGPEIASRTQVAISDVILALASGAAGALALTTGVSAALVGVMVAVALLPPTIGLGLMLGGGYWSEAGGAGLLLATNIICVNLAGIVTFLAQDIGPRTWWEAKRARRNARIALLTWCSFLVMLILLILYY